MPQLYPESVERLINEFNKMPGIGARSAERLAFHILASSSEEAMSLAHAINDVKKGIRACARCFNAAEGELCHICLDAGRSTQAICVVELPRDIIALEKCGSFAGSYHCLQGKIDPTAGVGPAQLRINELFKRIEEDSVEEVILALNPTTEGDATASYLADKLAESFAGLTISRLARGLAAGTDLESTAPSSLTSALKERQAVIKE